VAEIRTRSGTGWLGRIIFADGQKSSDCCCALRYSSPSSKPRSASKAAGETALQAMPKSGSSSPLSPQMFDSSSRSHSGWCRKGWRSSGIFSRQESSARTPFIDFKCTDHLAQTAWRAQTTTASGAAAGSSRPAAPFPSWPDAEKEFQARRLWMGRKRALGPDQQMGGGEIFPPRGGQKKSGG